MAAKKTAKKAPAKKTATPAKKTPTKKKVVEKKAPTKKKVATKKAPAKKKAIAKVKYTAEQVYSMIEQAAYFAAENDGFCQDPAAYWAQAESSINQMVKG